MRGGYKHLEWHEVYVTIQINIRVSIFDSPIYSHKTRIDLDIRVVNCTHVHTFPYTYISRVYASLKCIYETRVYITLYNIILH